VDYGFHSADDPHTMRYLLPPLLELSGSLTPQTRVLDVGCGNGAFAGRYLAKGCRVVGIDLGESGLAVARKQYPKARFELLPADEQILERLGEEPFDVVISTEVVEHVYAPRSYAAGCFAALRPGGRFVLTTPYHGFLKNVAIAVSGKFDAHVNPLWDGGHIKFWSRDTLTQLLTEVGFQDVDFRGAGRLPYLWMSMVLGATKPLGATPARG
jgi:2-polyprenyl-6-hydroxyphenyl methylase/3-demethylubiquinone-9 3-methyltransferase